MSLPDPKTRREVYLNGIASGSSVDLTPHTREEVYLDAIANNGGGGGGGTTVVANPELAGTEADLTGLQVGDTKYKVPSGGGGGVFIVNMDIETMTLGNTWQEIHDAGFAVVKVEPAEGYRQIYPVIETSPDGAHYKVSILTDQGAMNFVTNSPNGYPVISQ